MIDFLKRFALFFVIFYVVLLVFAPDPSQKQTLDDTEILVESSYTIGNMIEIGLQNNTDAPLIVAAETCETAAIQVHQYKNGEWNFLPNACIKNIELAPGENKMISIDKIMYEEYKETGEYKVVVQYESKKYEETFALSEAGFFKQIWIVFVYQPIYNLLIWFVTLLPNHSLGWSIIMLTIFVRLLLFIPNHKALKSQQELQKIQPILEKLKAKHKDSPQKLSEETMKVWKKHKVNPLGSCLPMLFQMPVLLAIFFVLKQGLSSYNVVFLYPFFQDFSYELMQTQFYILDLQSMGTWYLAIVVGLLQMWQIRLSMAKTNDKKAVIDVNAEGNIMQDQMKMMNMMMQYVLPIMMMFFVSSLPAGVGIYWGVSTLFGIVQNIIIKRSLAKA